MPPHGIGGVGFSIDRPVSSEAHNFWLFAFFYIRKGYCWIYWEMASGYCLRILVVYVSCEKVDLGSRGHSWMTSPDEYRLCNFPER